MLKSCQQQSHTFMRTLLPSGSQERVSLFLRGPGGTGFPGPAVWGVPARPRLRHPGVLAGAGPAGTAPGPRGDVTGALQRRGCSPRGWRWQPLRREAPVWSLGPRVAVARPPGQQNKLLAGRGGKSPASDSEHDAAPPLPSTMPDPGRAAPTLGPSRAPRSPSAAWALPSGRRESHVSVSTGPGSSCSGASTLFSRCRRGSTTTPARRRTGFCVQKAPLL